MSTDTKAEAKEIAPANEALYAAVEEGSLEKLNEAVASGADVNFLSLKKLPGWDEEIFGIKGTCNSALHLACCLGSERIIIDRLLELGSDVFLKNIDDGYLPIHIAACFGKADLVGLLLDKGCDPSTTDFYGGSLLLYATEAMSDNGQHEVAELLLDRGADINDSSNRGFTPLMIACVDGRKEMVELFLDRGADVDAENDDGFTALLIASSNGNKEVAELLLDRGADISVATRNYGYTSLILATIQDEKEVVKLLLYRGADISTVSNDGTTAFDNASNEHYDEIARTLHRWSFTMGILSLQELSLYYKLDCSSIIDFWQYIAENLDE
jgi:ankyrin repeat protein